MPSPHTPTDATTILFEATEPLLLALKSVVDRQIGRLADKPVPATTMSEAQAILAAARRIFSREPIVPRLLELQRSVDWAGLATKLAIAAAAFAAFKANFRIWEESVEGHLWLTREWAKASRARPRSPLPDSDFEEFSDDLSMPL
jgi:hypothetical protein